MYPPNIDVKQRQLMLERKRIVHTDGTIDLVNETKLWSFDQDAVRKALARMIIMDELPFMFVERGGFSQFCKVGLPYFVIPSRITIARDCYEIFIEERNTMKNLFAKLSSKVCLTTDTWTSGKNLSYMCLTAHFIDDDWNLHKKIINFCPIAGHSGEFIGRVVEKCLIEWGLKNILTMTVDNASSNDLAIRYLKKSMDHWDNNVLDGRYFHMRCVAHILNLVVKDGLKDLDASIKRVRNIVRYVRSSPSRLQSFKSFVDEEKIENKGLVCLDVNTRWNSTFLMLKTALIFKKAFKSLDFKNQSCSKELKKSCGPPTKDDWKRIEFFLPFLKIFYDATIKLSGNQYVTGNYYVPEILGVGELIFSYCEKMDEGLQRMAKQMRVKYDKYWGKVENLNILLFIALILDPRYKLSIVEWIIRKSYDEVNAEWLCSTLKNTLKSLFDYYATSLPTARTSHQKSTSFSSSVVDSHREQDITEELDMQQLLLLKFNKENEGFDETTRKSELDKYLIKEREPSGKTFDILNWWKIHRVTFPVTSTMAKDLLAIPVSTVASESAFSTGGRVLDSFRTCLSPRMVEALVCTQDWLRTSDRPIIIENIIFELHNMKEGMKELTLNQPTIIIDESAIISDDEEFYEV